LKLLLKVRTSKSYMGYNFFINWTFTGKVILIFVETRGRGTIQARTLAIGIVLNDYKGESGVQGEKRG